MTTMPPPGPRRAALVAGVAGVKAYRDGRPVTDVPYAYERPLARRAWLTGWSAAKRADTGKDLTDVDEEADVGAPWPGDAPTR